MSSNVGRGNQVGKSQSRYSRSYVLEDKYFVNIQQSEPFRILHGRDEISCTQLLPVYDYSIKKQNTGKGKKDVEVNQDIYFGPIAAAFCAGPISKVYKLYYSDELICDWSANPIDFTTGQSQQMISLGSAYGVFYLYRGDTNRPVYPAGTNELIDNIFTRAITIADGCVIPARLHPAYRNVFYFTSPKFRLGNAAEMPNLRIEVEKIPDCAELFTITKNGILETSGNNDDGDAYPPLIIWDYLTNTHWGSSCLTAEQLDKDSFQEALEICVDENIAISSCIDSDKSIRDAVSNILQYCDGVLYRKDNGLIAIKLIRTPSDLSTLDEITLDDLIEEPDVEWTSETWGTTKISFNDRSNYYEGTSEAFESPLFQTTNGELVTKEFDLPFIKNRVLAAQIGMRLGSAGAIPSCEARLKIAHNNTANGQTRFHVGDIIKFRYAQYNLPYQYLRINEVRYGSPKNNYVEIVGVTDVGTVLDIPYAPRSISVPPRVVPILENKEGYLQPRILPANSGFGTVIFAERATAAAITSYSVKCEAFALNADTAVESADVGTTGAYHDYEVLAQIQSATVSSNGRIIFTFSGINTARKEEIISVWNNDDEPRITVAAVRTRAFLNAGSTVNDLFPLTFKIVSAPDFTEDDLDSFSLSITASLVTSWGEPSENCQILTIKQNAYIYTSGAVANPQYSSNAWTTFIARKQFTVTGSYLNYAEEYPGVCKWEYNAGGVIITTRSGEDTTDSPYTYNSSWGESITITGYLYVGSVAPTGEIVAALGGVVWVDRITGDVYNYTGGAWVQQYTIAETAGKTSYDQLPVGTTAGTVAAGDHNHDDRYQLIGESSERYYQFFDADGTIAHTSAQNGIIHVNLTTSNNITITAPAADEAENGDCITLFVTRDDGVSAATYATVIVANDTVNIASGIILKLVCTTVNQTKSWQAIVLPRIG
jgi:hypothetical protein